ncbi:DUF2934 domain-containing protein [Myxococcus sp. K15C18031901]|uniref:DUF2934 domain-containing protein n=1 Tax=Myxococcus dinghuensis TaxID=2906761 RepID=UPI0020A7D087|nr:DUF2934 domain-containing protein [Myxococcus dinghuensis]MCP3104813.1 DUF2934 domain-containing protein [Myxococcus dinghuensis]
MARNSPHKSAPQGSRPDKSEQRPQSPTTSPLKAQPPHEQIARRAYEIFLARGGNHGDPEQDWHQAERELRLGRQ